MKIILSGGGTLGPVTPLLAIHDIIKKARPDTQFLWVGTRLGPERELIKQKGIEFRTLSSGKFRRYISIWNITDIIRIIIGFFQSIKIMWKENPDVCVSAGGFISVPLHWAAWLFGVPAWIHQQDVKVGLANKLMAPFAKVITTALSNSVIDFSKKKTKWLGNPVRAEVLRGDRRYAIKRFGLREDLPVIFATGGGTGSLRVNQLVVEASRHLEGVAQIIHLSGKERPRELTERASRLYDWYHHYEFFMDEMADAYAVADIVISRGGFGTITEIAALGKPAILIPKPGHQEENVKFLADAGAAIFVDERTSDGNYLGGIIKELLIDSIRQKQLAVRLSKMMPAAGEGEVMRVVEGLARFR
ncbi:MAG: UDP-N-acetylglucosamine--N-acetylmuramyl-(pentapeptide) pyrophosphoryl-undecaprenol N-acetylglucosamine transferase [Patescibacteria group bacterium]